MTSKPFVDWNQMLVFPLLRNEPFASWWISAPLICSPESVRLLRWSLQEEEAETFKIFEGAVMESDERVLQQSDAGPIGLSDPGITYAAGTTWFDFTLDMPDSELAGRHGHWVRETVDEAVVRMIRAAHSTQDAPATQQLRNALLA